MTVLHVVSAGENPDGRNAVGPLIAELAGHPDVRQALVTGSGSRLADEAADRGISVWTPRWRRRIDGEALAVLCARFADAWDVVHAHDAVAVQAALLARALAGGRSRVVAARRDDARAGHPYGWRRADLVIVDSAPMRDALIAQRVDRKRIELIRPAPAVDDEEPPSVEDTLRCYRAVARRSA